MGARLIGSEPDHLEIGFSLRLPVYNCAGVVIVIAFMACAFFQRATNAKIKGRDPITNSRQDSEEAKTPARPIVSDLWCMFALLA